MAKKKSTFKSSSAKNTAASTSATGSSTMSSPSSSSSSSPSSLSSSPNVPKNKSSSRGARGGAWPAGVAAAVVAILIALSIIAFLAVVHPNNNNNNKYFENSILNKFTSDVTLIDESSTFTISAATTTTPTTTTTTSAANTGNAANNDFPAIPTRSKNDDPSSSSEKKEAFLKWFLQNGGIFHPIPFPSDFSTGNAVNNTVDNTIRVKNGGAGDGDGGDGNNNSNDADNLKVTLEEFPSFGGWGLALNVPLFESTPAFMQGEENNNDECQSTTTTTTATTADSTSSVSTSTSAAPNSRSETSQCQENSNEHSPPPPPHSKLKDARHQHDPIIRHLDPLFTIPPSIILTVQSVLDAYSSSPHPSSSTNDGHDPHHHYYYPIDNFQNRLHQILKMAFPHGPGLIANNNADAIMGLVEQDVVMAMYLMVEECHHSLYAKNIISGGGSGAQSTDSHWGPYLDVLPQYLIPRLDTFGDEEYAILKDNVLEEEGRESKRLLETMFLGNDYDSGGTSDNSGGNGGKERKGSLQSILREMIQAKLNATSVTSTSNSDIEIIPSTCLDFNNFHRFVAIISSRAMVLKGVKYLTPLAEMINYKSKETRKATMQKSMDKANDLYGIDEERIPTPFDLYHTISKHDNSITVRSDRNVFVDGSSIDHYNEENGNAVIHLYEDYGPVDSSLFLQAHGFVPSENPFHCAMISGSLLLPLPGGSGGASSSNDDNDGNYGYVLRALKSLQLVHPGTQHFDGLENVCVRMDFKITDDGNTIGRKPASDSIAMASLLLDDSLDELDIDHVPVGDYDDSWNARKQTCINAIESGDRERVEIRCARYSDNEAVVRRALKNAVKASIQENGNGPQALNEDDKVMNSLRQQLVEAEENGRDQMAVALRFRIEERKILLHLAHHEEVTGDKRDEAGSVSSDEDDLEDKLEAFKAFVEILDLPVSKIEPKIVGDGMRIGAFATEKLEIGDTYISLTPNAVISVDTAIAEAGETHPALESLLRKYNNHDPDGFNVLLLYILHERFVLGQKSAWHPYLNLLPSIAELREFHPLFFTSQEIDTYLAGSDVRNHIYRYQRGASERHAALSSDLEAIDILGSEVLLDKNKFRWASSILDARSIWWEGKRHLVPLLDLVNADGHGLAHETYLEPLESDPSQSVAVTRASRPVNPGEQVFENYAQPNWVLFSNHGFFLEKNPDDCAYLDGLFISRNDPGAADVYKLRTLLRTASPTFCIGPTESILQLVHFLRIKYRLPVDGPNPSESDLDDEVRPYAERILMERILRLEESMAVTSREQSVTRHQVMREIVRNDLRRFLKALNSLSAD